MGHGESSHWFRNKTRFDSGVIAQIHDFCAHHGIHHFVLTTYDKWIFGLFTESAFVHIPILKHDLMPSSGFRLQSWFCSACYELQRAKSHRLTNSHFLDGRCHARSSQMLVRSSRIDAPISAFTLARGALFYSDSGSLFLWINYAYYINIVPTLFFFL